MEVHGGQSWKQRIASWLDQIVQPSIDHKIWTRLFKSEESLQQEKARQMQENRFIIHPFSPFRSMWDLIMVVVLVLTLVVLPIEIAFYIDDLFLDSWKAFNLTIDFIFLLDIALNFRTAYIHSQTEQVIMKNSTIIMHYLRTWFAVDIVSSVPLDYLVVAFYDTSSEEEAVESSGGNAIVIARTLKVLRLVKLLSLLKIFRVARLMRYVHKLEEVVGIESTMLGIVNLVIVIGVFAHWNACIQYLVCYISGFPEDSWVQKSHLLNDTITTWDKYTLAMYRALSHMLSIGYGMEPAESSLERWMIMTSMMLGATFYALFIAHMSSIVMGLDTSGRKYEEQVCQVREYMKFRRVPLDLQRRVLDYFEHRYMRKYFDENQILSDQHISYPLKKEILMHICRNLVQKVPYLASAPTEFIVDIITKLNLQVYFPGDIIVQAGKRGDSMFFVEHGKVEIQLPSGRVVNTLSDGSHFGEIALILEERRVASVVAIELCDIYCLMKKDFLDVLADHPHMLEIMELTAKERLSSLDKSGGGEQLDISDNQKFDDEGNISGKGEETAHAFIP